MTKTEREDCKEVSQIRICKVDRQLPTRADYESSLKNDPESYKVHSLCKRTLINGAEYYLVKTTNPSKWIVSTARKINATGYCQEEQQIIFLQASSLWAGDTNQPTNPVVGVTNIAGQGIIHTTMTIVIAVVGTVVYMMIYVAIRRLNEQTPPPETEAIYVPMHALDPTNRCELHGQQGNAERIYAVPRSPPVQVQENISNIITEERDGGVNL